MRERRSGQVIENVIEREDGREREKQREGERERERERDREREREREREILLFSDGDQMAQSREVNLIFTIMSSSL